MNTLTAKNDLETKNDLEWFDAMCALLKKEEKPSTNQLSEILGVEKPNPTGEIRGSKFIEPFDKRFKWICINPDLSNNEADKPIEYLALGGEDFALKNSDIIKRFPNYKTQINTYDGGTQFFFYPIPEIYEFTALDFWTRKESHELGNTSDLTFNSVTFMFGDRLTKGRTGYAVKR